MNGLSALFLVVPFHAFPLGQNILYTHLARNLFLYLLRFRHHQADLSVGLHRQYVRHLPGRLYPHILYAQLFHDHGCCPVFRRCCSLPGIRRHVFPPGFCRRFPCGSFPRPFRQLALRRFLFRFRLCSLRRLQRIDLFLFRYLPGGFGHIRRIHGVYLSGGAEEDFRLRLLLRNLLSVFSRRRHCRFFVRLFPVVLHHGRYDAAGDSILRRLILLKHFPQTLRQLFLQIDGIILPHIHCLDLDLYLIRRDPDRGRTQQIYRLRRLLRLLRGAGLLHLRLLINRFRIILLSLFFLVNRLLLLIAGFRTLDIRLRLKTAVIPSLLFGGQRLMQHLQLHGLYHIFALSKPQNQLVALLDTLGGQPYPVIQICQLISPFFPIVFGFQLLQYGDALLQTHVLSLV